MQEKIHYEALSYLYENYDYTLYATDFGEDDYLGLKNFIEEAFPQKNIDEHKEQLKQAIVDFFEFYGQKVMVLFVKDSFIIKKHFFTEIKDEVFDRGYHEVFAQIMYMAENIDEYIVQDDLIVLDEDFYGFAVEKLDKLETSKIKDIIRKIVKDTFELDEKDIVFFLNNKVSIRKHIYKDSREAIYKEKHDRRFNGLPSCDLEDIKKQIDLNSFWTLLAMNLQDALDGELNIKNINNQTFHSISITVFQRIIANMIKRQFEDLEEPVLSGLTNFILREHFERIYMYISEHIFNLIKRRDPDVERFIKFYSQDIMIEKSRNMKIQKHPIKDRNNNLWNYTSILSISLQREKAREKIEEKNKEVLTVQSKIRDLERDLQIYKDKIEECTTSIIDLELELKEVYENIDYLKNISNDPSAMSSLREMFKLEEEMFGRKKDFKKMIASLEVAIENKVIEINNRIKKLDEMMALKEQTIKNSNEFESKYQLIIDAIAKAIGKKLQVVH